MDCIETFFNECYDGNFSVVESFLLKGISPNVQNAEGETALQISAANGFLNLVSLLLKKGALVDLSNNYGWTPLMHAAKYGYIDIVSFLIQKKAKVNVCNKLGIRAIDLATWSGNLACVKLLVKAGAVIDCMFFSGSQDEVCDMSPLMAASLRGHDILTRFLIQEKCSVDQASPITGLTPLMLAACNGHRTNVEILLEFGGDADITDKCGRTALDLAVSCGKDSVVTFLRDCTQPNVTKSSGGKLNEIDILRIVRNGDINQLKSILNQKRWLSNYVNPDDGVTPLMIACMQGFNDIVEVLIENRANLNAQDLTNGWTPLMYAVFHRQAETVNLLLDKGVDVDISTANGYTAIDLAIHADTSETDILGVLLAYAESEDSSDTFDFSNASPSSTLKSELSVEKISTRADSQVKFKEFLGGIASQIRQLSKSSTLSPAFDSEVFDETLNDVFEEPTEQKRFEKFLCISKFYAPNERFAHLLKEQEVGAIRLPPIPYHASHVNVMKTKFNGTKKKPIKPHFNSLRTPNLLKKYRMKNPVESSQLPEQYFFSDSLSSQDFQKTPTNSAENLKSSLLLNEFDEKSNTIDNISKNLTLEELDLGADCQDESKVIEDPHSTHERNNQDETNIGGLTALLSQASLKKYCEKFRDQEIDLETFQYLTEDDLSEIGINSFESRNQLLEIISKLKKD